MSDFTHSDPKLIFSDRGEDWSQSSVGFFFLQRGKFVTQLPTIHHTGEEVAHQSFALQFLLVTPEVRIED